MVWKAVCVVACLVGASGLCACSTTTTGAGPRDGGTTSGGDAGGPPIGATCTTSATCDVAGGACSNAMFADGPLFPTAICLQDGCQAPAAGELALCGTTANPGLCASITSTQTICFPLCVVSAAGAVTGCLANDVCQLLGTSEDPTTLAPELIGQCQPGCTADAQCPSGSSCDTYQGNCVATVTPQTEAFGAPCDPATDTGCACIGPSGGSVGFCSSACVTGGTCPAFGALPAAGTDGGADADAGTAPPLPFVCSAQLGGLNALDAGVYLATQPAGLDGYCFPACDTASDCAFYGSGATCTPDPAGGTHLGICSLTQ